MGRKHFLRKLMVAVGAILLPKISIENSPKNFDDFEFGPLTIIDPEYRTGRLIWVGDKVEFVPDENGNLKLYNDAFQSNS